MDAVKFVDRGDWGVVEYGSYPDPEVGPSDVLVDVKAGALNHLDVVVNHVGAATWRQSLRSLAHGGRLLTRGATTGGHPETNVNRIFGNQLSILGSTMAGPGEVDDVLELVWDGTFEVRIRDVLPMSETARGHELLEDREGFGRVVVVPDSEYEGDR
jgi:NADPH:quinone reductase-like Zn-dependent oxidoreductase